MISYFVFDIGNVLFHYDPRYILRQLFGKVDSFYLDYFIDSDLWQQLDRGDIKISDVDLFLKEFYLVSSDQARDILRIEKEFVCFLKPIREMILWFHFLKARYPVYILSNFQNQPFDRLCGLYPFLNEAEGMIVSSKVGYNKPEPEIYHCLFSQYGLDPQEGFFIDDREENIDMAKQLYLEGHCFVNYPGFDLFMRKRFNFSIVQDVI